MSFQSESLAASVQKRMDRLTELRSEIAAIEAELAAVLDVLPRSTSDRPATHKRMPYQARRKPIKSGSTVDWTLRILSAHGGMPLHINQIIERIAIAGGPAVNRATLVSNLSRYVTRGDTFTRTRANTFALITVAASQPFVEPCEPAQKAS